MSDLMPLTILIIEKNGNVKEMEIKNFKEEELYKKCGFKKCEDFLKHHEWNNVKIDGNKYSISMYGKIEGRANSENKYDFPPPIDNKLFFGNCALVAKIKREENKINYVNLNSILWNKIYEKLFGGFEDLTKNAIVDEEEEDELANVSKNKKTKHGYLKDGFVVDSDGEDDDNFDDDSYSDEDSDDLENIECSAENNNDDIILEDLGSELSEEEYDD
jgi:hypothetical protein